MVAKKVTWIKIPAKIFFACKHFGTGVLIATAFVHVSIGEVKQGNASIYKTHIFPSYYPRHSAISWTPVFLIYSLSSTPRCQVLS